MVKEETQVKARGRGEMNKGRGGQNMRTGRGGSRGAFGNRGRPAPLARGGGNAGRPQNKNKK